MKKMKVAFLVVDDRFDKISDTPCFGAAPAAVLQGFEYFTDEVEVHVISCMQKTMPTPKKLADNIFFHGLVVRKWGFLRTLHFGCIRAVRAKLKELNPDIVHAQGTERWCAISGLTFQGPKVLTIHGNLRLINKLVKPKPRLYWGLQTILEKFSIPRYEGVFCNSFSTEELIKPFSKRTWRVDNPIREIFFSNRIISTKSSADIVFLNVGVVQERKRQLEVGRLFQKMRRLGLSVKVRFVGSVGLGSYQNSFIQMVKEGINEGFADYVGVKKGDALVTEMDQADAFIHAPIEEAFGLVIPESLSRGLKLFTTRVGGIIDIIEGIEGVVSVEADDWDGFSKLITQWVKSGAKHNESTLHMVTNRYSPRVIASEHINIYKELVLDV